MSIRLRCWPVMLTAAAILLAPLAIPAAAQDPPAADQGDAAAEKDIYAVPAVNDPTELVRFMNGLLQIRPKTRAEAEQHQTKILPALRTAAERIMALEKDADSEAALLARRILLQVRIVELPKASPQDAEKLFADMQKHLKDIKQPEVMDFGMTVQLARGLEQIGHPLAGTAYKQFGNLLAKQSNEGIAMRGKLMEGAARRLTLVGKPLELAGTTVEGKAFNLKDLDGKVVLVDFWATWCGPCKAELPNIKANYDKYHEKGFEVVGVSLDQDRVALEEYLKEQQIPWSTLHENDGTGQHPATVHYAIEAIPFMALIGRNGKVLSITAQGETLNKLLAEQFPE